MTSNGTPLPTLRFTASAAAGPTRFDDWIERAAPLWTVDSDPGSIARFQWSGTSRLLGRAILSEVRCDAHVMRRDRALIGRMGIDHIIVLVRRARQCSLQPDREVLTIDPGDICFLDLSRPMWADVPDLDCITITMPRAVIAPLLRDPDALHGLVVPATTPAARLAMAHLEALVRDAPGLAVGQAGLVLQATAALLAACAAVALANPDRTRADARPAVLLTLRRHVEQHLTDPDLDADSLARRFALSRSTIYRLFRPLGGIAGFIRRRRLAAAHALLADPRNTRRISEIAYLFHLGSDSSFSHAFKREFGLSPRALQAHLARDGAVPPPLSADGRLYDWFLDLA